MNRTVEALKQSEDALARVFAEKAFQTHFGFGLERA